MVKKCKVIFNNDYVTVINFDGKEIQIPSIKKDAKFVNILKKDEKYFVVDDNHKEDTPVLAERGQKETKKKTTNNKRAKIKTENKPVFDEDKADDENV